MPWGLSVINKLANCTTSPLPATIFVHNLKRARRWYVFYIVGYGVVPEHVHLLVSEPERATLALALQMLKQTASRRLKAIAGQNPFWQARYYDFNVWSECERVEKLRYMHRNPVKRGLVERPEDWRWSSSRHYYLTGEGVGVQIESQWTSRKREGMGSYPVVRRMESP